MPYGLEPQLLLNNPVDPYFRNALTQSWQQFGKDVQSGIARLAQNRQVRQLGEELSQINPESPLFAQQMTSAITRNPLGAETKAGVAAINLLGNQNEQYLRDRIELEDRAKWNAFINNPSVGATGVPQQPGAGRVEFRAGVAEPELPLAAANNPANGLAALTGNAAFRNLPPDAQRRLVEGQLRGENKPPSFRSGANDIVAVDPRTGEARVVYDSPQPEARTRLAEDRFKFTREQAGIRNDQSQQRIDEGAAAKREANELKLIAEERLTRNAAQAQANRTEAQKLKEKSALEKQLAKLPQPEWPYEEGGKVYITTTAGARKRVQGDLKSVMAAEQKKADEIQRIKDQLADIDRTTQEFNRTTAAFEEADLPKWTEFESLPSGAVFLDPDGKRRKKP